MLCLRTLSVLQRCGAEVAPTRGDQAQIAGEHFSSHQRWSAFQGCTVPDIERAVKYVHMFVHMGTIIILRAIIGEGCSLPATLPGYDCRDEWIVPKKRIHFLSIRKLFPYMACVLERNDLAPATWGMASEMSVWPRPHCALFLIPPLPRAHRPIYGLLPGTPCLAPPTEGVVFETPLFARPVCYIWSYVAQIHSRTHVQFPGTLRGINAVAFKKASPVYELWSCSLATHIIGFLFCLRLRRLEKMVEVLGHIDFRGLLEVSDVLDRSLKGRGIWRRD